MKRVGGACAGEDEVTTVDSKTDTTADTSATSGLGRMTGQLHWPIQLGNAEEEGAGDRGTGNCVDEK
jgi:hypothetical protein